MIVAGESRRDGGGTDAGGVHIIELVEPTASPSPTPSTSPTSTPTPSSTLSPTPSPSPTSSWDRYNNLGGDDYFVDPALAIDGWDIKEDAALGGDATARVRENGRQLVLERHGCGSVTASLPLGYPAGEVSVEADGMYSSSANSTHVVDARI